jgi:proline iminopeptidase
VAALLRSGTLRVSVTDEVHWEEHGTPAGPPVLWCHGGPGSGLGPGYADALCTGGARMIGLDQRGCGRSRPLASDTAADLDGNTTPALVADLEAVREHLGVDSWIVSGQSWGTTLALAYAEAHPERVRGLALAAVTTTSTREVEWITEGVARLFPAEWESFAAAVPRHPGERIVDAYARALRDPGRRENAARAWCAWEDVHVSLTPGALPSRRYEDPAFRLLLATLVTHYWSHSGFGGDDLLPGAGALAGIPGVLIHGRRDVSSPLETPWRLHRAWPGSELIVLDEGHGGAATTAALRGAIARLVAS